VGDYRLDEQLPSTNLNTGQSTTYEFRISGEGNISSIEKPEVFNNPNFDVYEPNIRQNIRREGNRVVGTKSFSYFIIPKEPGMFKLGDYFNWIYFNTSAKKYDTLRSKYVLTVTGESQKNQAIESTDLGSFYDRVNAADNVLRKTEKKDWLKLSLNIFILLTLAGAAYLVFKK
jgi:hypothetical protein